MKKVTIYITAEPAFQVEAEKLLKHLESFNDNLTCRMLKSGPQPDLSESFSQQPAQAQTFSQQPAQAQTSSQQTAQAQAFSQQPAQSQTSSQRPAQAQAFSQQPAQSPASSAHTVPEQDQDPHAMILRFGEDGLTLISDGMELRGDFSRMLPRITKGRLASEQLVRAAKIKNADPDQERLTAIDCTAGLGEDSILLAAAGFHVIMFEHNPLIAALLRDSLRRARQSSDPLLAEIAGRMEMREGDSAKILTCIASSAASCESRAASVELGTASVELGTASGEAGTALGEVGTTPWPAQTISRTESSMSGKETWSQTLQHERPHVIFLDPMFPAKQKSGISKKKLQILQKLELPCAGEEELLHAAMSLDPVKIVIKRPIRGPFLAGIRPGYSIEGKTIRYDVITGSPVKVRK